MNRNRLPALVALMLAAATLSMTAMPVHAADTFADAPATNDPLGPARALIAEGRWRDAIAALKVVNATGNADWNNLMGYTHRKAKVPDLPVAEAYYNAALRIDAKHRGALAYSGELYLMLGQLPRAEERLAALDKACTSGCGELKELRAAIASFKANGNRYVTQP
jgi:tetratricopeptide (TPR) repeat protein